MRSNGELEDGGNGQQGDTYTDHVSNQDLATTELQDQPDTQGRTDNTHDTVSNLGGNGGGGGHTGVLQNLGGVVHNGVNTG